MIDWRIYFKGILGGVLGVAIALIVWHLWIDHNSLHQAINIINTLAAKHPEFFK